MREEASADDDDEKTRRKRGEIQLGACSSDSGSGSAVFAGVLACGFV